MIGRLPDSGLESWIWEGEGCLCRANVRKGELILLDAVLTGNRVSVSEPGFIGAACAVRRSLQHEQSEHLGRSRWTALGVSRVLGSNYRLSLTAASPS